MNATDELEQSTRPSVPSKQGPLLVICAGLGRTGTKSLKHALEIVYGQPCYHGFELFQHHPEHCAQWLEIDGQFATQGRIDPDRVHAIYRGYRCAADFPTCCYYEQLMEIYPEAKVILTTRDVKDWLRSVRQTILRHKPNGASDLIGRFVHRMQLGWYFPKLLDTVWKRCLGSQCDLNNDRDLIEAYNTWVQQVEKTVPKDRLLVFDVKQGWTPLCQFLAVPIPEENFPRVNSWHDIATANQQVDRNARILRWIIPACVLVTMGLIIFQYL